MGPDKVEKLCQKAQLAIAERDWDAAKQAYLMALGLRSDLPDVHYGLATVYFQLRELTSAAHHFREVTRLDPLRAGAFVNLGAVLNVLQQYDEALTVLRRGIQLDSGRYEGFYNLGLVYRRKGQTELAITAYKEAIRINPKMADAHLNLGNLYMERDQPRQAISHYESGHQAAARLGKGGRQPGASPRRRRGGQASATAPAPGTQANAQDRATAPKADIDRLVDPVTHDTFLSNLHQISVVAEETGRLLQKVVAEELEPVLKELSTALLHTPRLARRARRLPRPVRVRP